MAIALAIRNRQRVCAVDLPLLKRITRTLIADLLHVAEADLGVFVVAAPEMTRLNETFLRHAGSTDVITFDYAEREEALHGEVFVCMDEALLQARRFRCPWQKELVRYVVHGVLHLQGFEDHAAAKRQRMKREENRLLRGLAARFPLSRLARTD